MLLGFDIGGTKCAVVIAEKNESGIKLFKKEKCFTDLTVSPEKMLSNLIILADRLLCGKRPDGVGISCGGPLDCQNGIILGPPNLPGWDNVEIVRQINEHYQAPVHLQNDANACAVAEWKFGAGQGCKNMVFLTFGSGLGAGLILNGELYSGTNDNAGEVGHIRLEKFGPVGYGKMGSFEGFCSGNGIGKLAYQMAIEESQKASYPSYFKKGMTESNLTAKMVADAAYNGDKTAIEVYKICGEHLGRGLSILIDILNPEVIIIGSVFVRSYDLLWKYAKEVIDKEALQLSSKCCKIVPAKLGEKIGDYASIAVALLEG